MSNETLNRPLPHDEEAEKFILGGIVLNNELILESLGDLSSDHFYIAQHKPIYRAMEHLANTSRPINHVTISQALKELGENIGSSGKELAEIISSLHRGVPKPKSLAYYVKTLKSRAIERDKIRTSDVLRTALLEGDADAVEQAEAKLQDLTIPTSNSGLERTKGFSTDVTKRIYNVGKSVTPITGVPTGFKDFDLATTGLQKDDFAVVAARPGVGKTAWGMNVVQFAAVQKKKSVAVFSLEMSKPQLYMRMLASEARISLHKIRTGFLTSSEWARLIHAQDTLDGANIFIDDTADTTPMKIKASAKRIITQTGSLDLIVIDYLQLMRSEKRTDNRLQELTNITRDVKIIAKELHTPVLAFSQLSRAVEQRSTNNHRPILSDLRESGTIEQDADIVGFLYREEMYGKTPDNEGLAELIIAKHRNGEIDTYQLAYTKEFTRFESLILC